VVKDRGRRYIGPAMAIRRTVRASSRSGVADDPAVCARRVPRSRFVERAPRYAVVLTTVLLLLLIAGCGGSSSKSSASSITPGSSSARSASAGGTYRRSTKAGGRQFPSFTLHAGLAFGIFRRYVYEPLKFQHLQDPAQRRADLVKRGIAAMAAYRELTKAKQAAEVGAPVMQLFAPLAALGATLNGLTDELKRGRSDPSDLELANSTIVNIEKTASSSGVKIAERAPASGR
jgi:hypothetical protein